MVEKKTPLENAARSSKHERIWIYFAWEISTTQWRDIRRSLHFLLSLLLSRILLQSTLFPAACKCINSFACLVCQCPYTLREIQQRLTLLSNCGKRANVTIVGLTLPAMHFQLKFEIIFYNYKWIYNCCSNQNVDFFIYNNKVSALVD